MIDAPACTSCGGLVTAERDAALRELAWWLEYVRRQGLIGDADVVARLHENERILAKRGVKP